MTTAAALFSLAGRSAFVTGAGRGLGTAIARGLAEAGARVALADIDREAVESAADALRDAGHEAIAMPLDVRDEAAFQLCGADEWDDVLAVNLRGSFFGCRIAGRHMRERSAGRIVNLGSMAGQQASAATGVHYAASKAGVIALTRAFAQALAPHGVTVNALAPAAVRSPVLEAMDESRQRTLAAGIPLGRFGEPEEVAAAVLYLASPAAAFITGATLDLNGGRLMR
jgi:3-oxoacyl-[acyl-carrier protein] reductase